MWLYVKIKIDVVNKFSVDYFYLWIIIQDVSIVWCINCGFKCSYSIASLKKSLWSERREIDEVFIKLVWSDRTHKKTFEKKVIQKFGEIAKLIIVE